MRLAVRAIALCAVLAAAAAAAQAADSEADTRAEQCPPDWQADGAMANLAGAPRESYQRMYEKYLGRYRYCAEAGAAKVLEIGIDGAATKYRLLGDYIGAEHVEWHALALNGSTKAAGAAYPANVMAGTTSHDDLDAVAKKWGPFDVIIDDAQGRPTQDQRAAFEHAFLAHLKPGGTYFALGLATSYHPRFGGTVAAQAERSTMMVLVQDLIAGMNFHWWCSKSYNPRAKGKYGQVIDGKQFQLHTALLDWVHVVDCGRGVCAMRKRPEKLVMTLCRW
jgi:hypothetical protein